MQVSEETQREIGIKGRAIYDDKLKAILEGDRLGDWVVIHVDKDDYAVAKNRWDAIQEMLSRHGADGRLNARRIGPPTESDFRLMQRLHPADGIKPA